MFVNVKIRNKITGEIIDTDENGVFADISFIPDGSIEVEALGTCIDNSTWTAPGTIETNLDVNDYEVIGIDFISQ